MTSRIVLSAAVAACVLVPVRAARAQGQVDVVTARRDVGQYAGMCGSHTGEDKLTGGVELVNYDTDDNTALYSG